MKLLYASVTAVLVSGCAGQTEMRQLAGDTASVMNDYRRELNAFAERQSAANAANQVRISNLRASRTMSEAYVRQRMSALKVAGDKNALETYDLLASNSADQLIARSPLLNDSSATASPPTVKFDGAAVETLTRQLNVLRKPPTYWDRVRQAIAYGEGLRDAYAASLSDARAVADSADAAAEQAAMAITGVPEGE